MTPIFESLPIAAPLDGYIEAVGRRLYRSSNPPKHFRFPSWSPVNFTVDNGHDIDGSSKTISVWEVSTMHGCRVSGFNSFGLCLTGPDTVDDLKRLGLLDRFLYDLDKLWFNMRH